MIQIYSKFYMVKIYFIQKMTEFTIQNFELLWVHIILPVVYKN